MCTAKASGGFGVSSCAPEDEPLATADFERVSISFGDYRSSLCAADALHLAICARTAATPCTFDHTLADAAANPGLAVMRIE
jgi:predicted nucleic acid-binding protein